MTLYSPARAADVGADAVRRRLEGKRVDVAGTAFKVLLWIALSVSIIVLFVLLYDVVTGGWGTLSTRLGDFLTSGLASSPEESGVAQAIRGTFFIGLFVVLLAFPIGI